MVNTQETQRTGPAAENDSLTLPPAPRQHEARGANPFGFIGGALLALGGAMQAHGAETPPAETQRRPTTEAVGRNLAFVSANTAALERVELIHVAIIHPVGGNPSPIVLQRVVESQLKAISFLRKNKDATVICEGVTIDLTPELYKAQRAEKSNPEIEAARFLFKGGFPSSYDKLSPEQRMAIYSSGAAPLLWLTGDLPTVKAALSDEAEADIRRAIERRFKVIKDRQPEKFTDKGKLKGGAKALEEIIEGDPPLWKLVTTERDKLALEVAQEAKKAGAEKIIIIYGAKHDFGALQAEYPEFAIRRVELLPDTPRPAGK